LVQDTISTTPWTHHEAVVNGVRLHYVKAGSGPLVILLHGFPEFWYSWRFQIPVLAAAGYRVVAPDMRGFNTSEKPPGVRSYLIDTLSDDVAALIHHLGESKAVVAGHDWGGAVAWYMPMRHPTIVERLIVLNAPHPSAFVRELRTIRQLRRSWYMFFFQLPWLPEAALHARRFAMLDRVMRNDPVRADAFSDEDIRRYKHALNQPGALTATINYYRASFRRNPREAMQEPPPISCPTMLIWGEQDRYLGIPLTEGLEQWVPDVRIERIPNASHWVQVDAPERVNELMLNFLTRP
jgi:pimeloyl-ACP methyl ester carboxylesterase